MPEIAITVSFVAILLLVAIVMVKSSLSLKKPFAPPKVQLAHHSVSNNTEAYNIATHMERRMRSQYERGEVPQVVLVDIHNYEKLSPNDQPFAIVSSDHLFPMTLENLVRKELVYLLGLEMTSLASENVMDQQNEVVGIRYFLISDKDRIRR